MSEIIKCPNCGEPIYIPDEQTDTVTPRNHEFVPDRNPVPDEKPDMADLEPLGYEQLSPEERAELLNG